MDYEASFEHGIAEEAGVLDIALPGVEVLDHKKALVASHGDQGHSLEEVA